MSNKSSQSQVPIVASKLFVALNSGNVVCPSRTQQPWQATNIVSADQNVILEQKILINQQRMVIDHLEAALSSHKDIAATLTDELLTTRHRLASVERTKQSLAEEVSYLSSLVVSELPESLTLPVQQSTVFETSSPINDEGRLDDIDEGKSIDSATAVFRHLESAKATSVSSLENDESMTGKTADYYDDSSCESKLSGKEKSTQQGRRLESSPSCDTTEVKTETQHALYRSGGLRTSKRHGNLLELLRTSVPKSQDVPPVVLVPKNWSSCTKKGSDDTFIENEASGCHQLERQKMFSKMMQRVDSLCLSPKKRPSTTQTGETEEEDGHFALQQMTASCNNTHLHGSSTRKKRRLCKSI